MCVSASVAHRAAVSEIKLYERNSEPSPRSETNGRRIVSLLDCLRLAVQSAAVGSAAGGAAALQVQRNTCRLAAR